jgi:uncharacterized protein
MMMITQDYLYEIEIKCPVCEHTYKTAKLRSKYIIIEKHDSDFCSYYKDEKHNPLFYYVNVCPFCGYSHSDEFSPTFKPYTLNNIQQKICNQWEKQNYCLERTYQEAINTYKLGIFSAILKQEKHINLAGLYLRLAWLYRTYEKNEQEERFIALALEEYISSYMKEDYTGTDMSEFRVLYLIGELSRRMNNENQAVLYFSKIIEQQKKAMEKYIVEMAKDRWYEIRDNRSAKAVNE